MRTQRRPTVGVSCRAGLAKTPSQQNRLQSQSAVVFERRRRGRLHALLGGTDSGAPAHPSPETDGEKDGRGREDECPQGQPREHGNQGDL